MTPSEILSELRARGFLHRRALGQNFLFDPNLLRAIADAGGVGPGDAVLEIGTGPGTLTAVLAERAGRVITVEVDARLADLAREVVSPRENVQWISGDALDGPTGIHPEIEAGLSAAAHDGLVPKCVANFPYSIATPFLVRLLERAAAERAFPLDLIAGTVQREVAQRLAAKEISKDYGVPSVLVAALADVTVERRIGPQAFIPRPHVESAVVRLRPRKLADCVRDVYPELANLVRGVFRFRRKTVRNALERTFEHPAARLDDALRAAGVSATARVESLSVDRLCALAHALRQPCRNPAE